jgi:hypothetical protein
VVAQYCDCAVGLFAVIHGIGTIHCGQQIREMVNDLHEWNGTVIEVGDKIVRSDARLFIVGGPEFLELRFQFGPALVRMDALGHALLPDGLPGMVAYRAALGQYNPHCRGVRHTRKLRQCADEFNNECASQRDGICAVHAIIEQARESAFGLLLRLACNLVPDPGLHQTGNAQVVGVGQMTLRQQSKNIACALDGQVLKDMLQYVVRKVFEAWHHRSTS